MDRLGAAFVDFAVILLACLVATLLGLLLGRLGDTVGLGSATAAVGSLDLATQVYLVALPYLALTEGRRGEHRGQTFGKQLAGIRTVSARTGAPAGRIRALVRAALLAAVIPLMFPLLGLLEWARAGDLSGKLAYGAVVLAGLTAAVAQRRRTYYDHLLGTAVVGTATDATSPQPLPIRGRPLNALEILYCLSWLAWAVPDALGFWDQ